MKIKVSREWLKACGRDSSKPGFTDTFEVTRVQEMRNGEKMYHVIDIDGRDWAVWSIRGVTELDETLTVKIDQTALDAIVADLIKQFNTRNHMVEIGLRKQESALMNLVVQTEVLHDSIAALHKMAKVEITEFSHGLVLDAQIREATSILAQLLSVKHNMKAE